MDSQDPNSHPTETPSTGIGMAEPIYVAPKAGTEADTFVVPPADGTPPAPTQVEIPQIPTPTPDNPFIPSVQPQGAATAPAKGGGNPLIKIMAIVGGVIVLAVLAMVGMKLFSGSGSGGSGTTGTGLPSVGTTGKAVTIQYWGLWENDANFRQFLSDFETSHPKIKVQYTQESPKQYRERLQAAINRGEGPDVFRFHNTWIPMLRQQLASVPTTVMTPSQFSATFFPVINNDLIAGQTIFGIPIMIDGLGLYINEALFATAGASEPTTWTDVINLVPKLTVKNGTAIVTGAIALGTANNVEHMSDILALMFLQNGANLKNLSGKEAEGTLIFYRKFADPSDPLYTWSDGMDSSIPAFANGRVAMILAPSWRAHDIAQLNPKLRFHIIPVPQLQGNNVAWASYWVEGVSSKSKNQEAAWEFVKYMTSSEGASKLYTEATKSRLFGEPYARMDMANTLANDPYAGAYEKQASFARSFPLASRTGDNGLNDRLIQYLTDAVNNVSSGMSPSQALVTLVQGFRQVFTSYNISTDTVEPTSAP